MKTIRRMTVLNIVIMSAIFCIAQFSPKKPATVCKSHCRQTTAGASISEAEDFSLMGLLTLKFM
jgi:hypothetical protein